MEFLEPIIQHERQTSVESIFNVQDQSKLELVNKMNNKKLLVILWTNIKKKRIAKILYIYFMEKYGDFKNFFKLIKFTKMNSQPNKLKTRKKSIKTY